MAHKKKLQQFLFFIIFFHCCIVIGLMIISLSTNNWVVAEPYRQLDSFGKKNLIIINSMATESVGDDSTSTPVMTSLNKSNDTLVGNNSLAGSKKLTYIDSPTNVTELESNDYVVGLTNSFLDEEEDNEEDNTMPIDLHAKKNCKRYSGRIKFGLFKGLWLLNYAYGCKNRAHIVSMIEIISRHQIFNQTLWLATILACSLASFTTVICAVLALLNVFFTPNRIIDGPNSLYIWNSISSFSHMLAVAFFTTLYFLDITKNVLTKDELDSGWTSTGRAKLSWSYYLIVVALVFKIADFIIIFFIARIKNSLTKIRAPVETNFSLITEDITCTHKNDSPSILLTRHYETSRNLPSRESTRLKKIIDFIY